MQFDSNGVGMVHMQNQGKNASRVISGARQRQARVAKERYCRMVPGDVLELLHDHQGRYAFKLVETSPSPQPRLKDTLLVASFRDFTKPRLELEGPRKLPTPAQSMADAQARADAAHTEAGAAEGGGGDGGGGASSGLARARARAAGGARVDKVGEGAGMDGLGGGGVAGEEQAVGGTGADWALKAVADEAEGGQGTQVATSKATTQAEAKAALRGGAASQGLHGLPPGVIVNIMGFLTLPERSRACSLSHRLDRCISIAGLMGEMPIGPLMGGLSTPPIQLLDLLLRRSQGSSRRLDFSHCRWATAGHVLAFMGMHMAVAQHPLAVAQGADQGTRTDLEYDAARDALVLAGAGATDGSSAMEDSMPANVNGDASRDGGDGMGVGAGGRVQPTVRRDVALAFPSWALAAGGDASTSGPTRYIDWWHAISCGLQVQPMHRGGAEALSLAHSLSREEPQDLFEMEELNDRHEAPYATTDAANTGRAGQDKPGDWLHPALRRAYRACENPSTEVAETLMGQTNSMGVQDAAMCLRGFVLTHLPDRRELLAHLLHPNQDAAACIAVSRRASVEAYLETRREGMCPAEDDLKLLTPSDDAPTLLPADEACHLMLPLGMQPAPPHAVPQAPMDAGADAASSGAGTEAEAEGSPDDGRADAALKGVATDLSVRLDALQRRHEPPTGGAGKGAGKKGAAAMGAGANVGGAAPMESSPGDDDSDLSWRRRETELEWLTRNVPRAKDHLASQRVVYYTMACADVFQFSYELERLHGRRAVVEAAMRSTITETDVDPAVLQSTKEEAMIAAARAAPALSLNCLHPWNRRGSLIREERLAAPSLDYCQHVLPMPAAAPTMAHPLAVRGADAEGRSAGAAGVMSASGGGSITGSDPAARFHEDGPFLPAESAASSAGRGLATRPRLLHGALPRPLFASGVRSLNLHGCLSIRPENLQLILSYAPVLEELDIGLCQQFSTADLCQLPRLMPKLRRIGLEYLHKANDIFLEELGRHCPSLEHLLVPGCYFITDAGLSKLSTGCRKITHVDVRGCRNVTGSGLVDIAKEGKASLRHLSMCGLPLVTPETMTRLMRWSLRLESLKAEMWSEEDGDLGADGVARKRRSYRVLSNVDSALRYIVSTVPQDSPDVLDLKKLHPRYGDAERMVEDRQRRAEEEGAAGAGSGEEDGDQ